MWCQHLATAPWDQGCVSHMPNPRGGDLSLHNSQKDASPPKLGQPSRGTVGLPSHTGMQELHQDLGPVGSKGTDVISNWATHPTLKEGFHLPPALISLGQLRVHLCSQTQLQQCRGDVARRWQWWPGQARTPGQGRGKGLGA